MTFQGRFNKLVLTSWWKMLMLGEPMCGGVEGTEGQWKIFVPCTKFGYETKIALKKIYFFKREAYRQDYEIKILILISYLDDCSV